MSAGLVVVTGANRGIGLELVSQLKAAGREVLAACRSASEGLKQLGVQVVEGVDVADHATLDALATACAGRPVSVLINNAGVLSQESLDSMDFDRIRKQFEVNSLGPLAVTMKLRPLLGEGSKVVIITSKMGSIDDNGSGGMYGYRMSKAAVNMMGKSLANDLKGKGIAVGIFHPGMVETDMTAPFGVKAGTGPAIDVKTSAEKLLRLTADLSLESTGKFLDAKNDGAEIPW